MWWQVLALAATAVSVSGHGRVLDPPSRGTMWRYGFSTQPNYDDDGLNCGGFYHQYGVNGGKCGICGDPYDMSSPRTHEIGGTYGQGIVVAEYEAGQVITATVEITAYHKGYWVFKICRDPYSTDQECFDANPVELEQGGTQYYPPNGGRFHVKYRLPSNIVCDHCVLQWRYVAGNNWGDCRNGTQGLGCGDQENFLACTDISIRPSAYIPAEAIPMPLDFDLEGLMKVLRDYAMTPKKTKPKNKNKKKKKNHRKPRLNKHGRRKKVKVFCPTRHKNVLCQATKRNT